jgi:hypothetical protein
LYWASSWGSELLSVRCVSSGPPWSTTTPIMLNEAWTPDAPKMIHLDAMLSASSCIISPTARRDGLTVRMVELRRMKYAGVPLGRLSNEPGNDIGGTVRRNQA